MQQFVKEGHLRWDSLGEYLALACSLEDLGVKTQNEKVRKLADALTIATGKVAMAEREGGEREREREICIHISGNSRTHETSPPAM